MKVVAITGKLQAACVEKPMPKIRQDFVLVKIEIAPMCTEYKAYKEGWISDTLGHEAAGVVVEVAQPGKVKVGDRVVVMPQYPCGKCSLCMRGDYGKTIQSIHLYDAVINHHLTTVNQIDAWMSTQIETSSPSVPG